MTRTRLSLVDTTLRDVVVQFAPARTMEDLQP